MTLSSIKTQLEEYHRLHDHAGIDEVGAAIDKLSDALFKMECEEEEIEGAREARHIRETRLSGKELGVT